MYIYAETPDYLAHSSVLKDADGLQFNSFHGEAYF